MGSRIPRQREVKGKGVKACEAKIMGRDVESTPYCDCHKVLPFRLRFPRPSVPAPASWTLSWAGYRPALTCVPC